MPELSTKPRNEARRRRYAEDSDYRAKVNARSRASHAAHRQQRLERQRQWWQSIGPQQRRGRGLKHYGITLEAYEKLLELQGSACAICREKFTATPHVDHCHVTRKVRGLVCRRCNTGLGCFQDDERLTMAATAYLRKAAADVAWTCASTTMIP
jgi:hypothetical protein